MAFQPMSRPWPLRWIKKPALALILAAVSSLSAADTLKEQFETPPDQARPWVYWWWMGHVTHATITRDLQALKDKGIGGMMLYQCDHLPQKVFGQRLEQWSPEWNEMIRFADAEAKRLKLGFIINYTSGSSGCGGPWIPVEKSGQILVWSGARLEGGKPVELQLPKPEVREGFYRDVAVMAYRVKPGASDAMRDAAPGLKVSGVENFYFFEREDLLDGDPSSYWTCRGDRPSETIELSFELPFTADSLCLVPRPGFAPSTAEIQVSDDAKTWRSLTKSAMDPKNNTVMAFPQTSSRFFRVELTRGQNTHFGLSEIRLLAPGEEASNVLSPYPYYATQMGRQHLTDASRPVLRQAGANDPKTPPDISATSELVDLTASMDEQGKLRWNAPPGQWQILRFGRTCLGWHARADQKGFHVDYMDPSAVELHMTRGIDPFLKAIGYGPDSAIQALHEDSFELPFNRWTGNFAQEFRQRRGYDLLPWLPVLAGRVIESKQAGERFLWDYRLTIAELCATHWQAAQELLHKRGLKFESEAAGPQPQSFDALAQLGRTDIAMGEFWSKIYRPGLSIDEQRRGCWPGSDCETIRQTASAAHIYGKPLVAAESFTGYSRPFAMDPFDVKAMGDRALCDGLNRFVIHLFMSQPIEEYEGKPALVRLHAFDYNIRATWFEQSRFWTDYLARCSAMLQQGRPVADIACFIGETAPSFVPAREFMKPEIPTGYDFDACNAEVLLQGRVEAGRLVLPGGGHYALLTLPPEANSMTPAMARKLRELVRAGMTLLGPRPRFSPSLSDRATADEQVRQIADELWGQSSSGENRCGQGQVLWGKPLSDVLESLNCPPALITGSPDVLSVERNVDQGTLFFLSNQAKKPLSITGSFRAPPGCAPELWDPATGRSLPAPVYRVVKGRTEVPLRLDPRGSLFVVFRTASPSGHWTSVKKDGLPLSTSPDLVLDGQKGELTSWEAGAFELENAAGNKHTLSIASVPEATDLSKDWELTFDGLGETIPMGNLVSWTTLEKEEMRAYSGTATYRRKFNWELNGAGQTQRVDLDLGELKNIAQVSLNGKPLGLLWKPPYRLDITSALQTGSNLLEVRITNLLTNRIHGDFALPRDKQHIRAFGAIEQYKANADKDSLLPSGLWGPVRLRPAVVQSVSP